MKRWHRWLIALPSLMLLVAASQFAMRGTHGPSGNAGYLGSDNAGVEGVAGSATGNAIYGVNPAGGSGFIGYNIIGVLADSTAPDGIGLSASGHRAVSAVSTSFSPGAAGVYGHGTMLGVQGIASSGDAAAAGVSGQGSVGVSGTSATGFGVRGTTTSGTGVYGVLNVGGGGHAGYFDGRVHVAGTLSKSAGSFRIDHPLEPATKYLSHSFVESPDMKNIYDGVVTLGDDGSAVVELPEWFDALNKDFRYQLTCIGEHAPVYVAEKVQDNRFRIAGGYAGMEVSWQVTGTRDDEYARAYPIAVEELKAPQELGKFLHPELYHQPLTQRIEPTGRFAR